MKTRIALDPGGTTGVAVRLPDGKFETLTTNTSDELLQFIMDTRPDEIIYEEFNPIAARVDKYMLYTIRLVGAIKAACYILNIPGHAHIPSNRRRMLDESKRLLRERKRSFMTHEMDAFAHLLVFEDTHGL